MKKFALVTNTERDPGLVLTSRAIKLLESHGCEIYADRACRPYLGENKSIIYTQSGELFDKAECAVVFGGDGTIIRTSHETAPRNIALIGINLGHLGYTAELEVDEIELLEELFKGNYTIQERMMLNVTVIRDGALVKENAHALNDIVLSKGDLSVMIDIEMLCRGEMTGKYFADGLIISTPTGTTAYSLAAGGPVVDPSMDCICTTPICPQSFYAKPLIFAPDTELEFRKGKRGRGSLFMTLDGVDNMEILDNDRIIIRRSELTTRFIHIKNYNFYSLLRRKMFGI